MTDALDEAGVALVLDAPRGGDIGRGEVDLLERCPGRRRVSATGRASCLDVGDVGGARPRGALPELARLGVGALLGHLDPVGVGQPRRVAGRTGVDRVIGGDVVAPEASVSGQMALLPKPSAARWYSDSWPLPAPAPVKTVRIVTFWPSSRRLAIRPPQDRATSSGWGADEDVGHRLARILSGHQLREAMLAHEGHEDGRLQRLALKPSAAGRTRVMTWSRRVPIGITRRPSGASCSTSGTGTPATRRRRRWPRTEPRQVRRGCRHRPRTSTS